MGKPSQVVPKGTRKAYSGSSGNHPIVDIVQNVVIEEEKASITYWKYYPGRNGVYNIYIYIYMELQTTYPAEVKQHFFKNSS